MNEMKIVDTIINQFGVSPFSAGCRFIEDVVCFVLENTTISGNVNENLISSEAEGMAQAIADSCIPISTRGQWKTFVDLRLYDHALGHLVFDKTYMPEILIEDRLRDVAGMMLFHVGIDIAKMALRLSAEKDD